MKLYDVTLSSRLLLGSAQYPSPHILSGAVRGAAAEVVTVSLRRESGGAREGEGFWSLIRGLGVRVLPNTAGCHSIREAVTTAHMAREVFETPWIKLEVIGDSDLLQPDVFSTRRGGPHPERGRLPGVPYTTDDLGIAERLLRVGCRVLMPLAAPIGSGRGLNNPFGLRTMRSRFPDIPLIIDAGIACPHTLLKRWNSATTAFF